MPRPAATDGQNKFSRYRARQQHRGMRLLRLWVPDLAGPDFAAEARRQAALLRGAPEEAAALEDIASLADLADEASAGR